MTRPAANLSLAPSKSRPSPQEGDQPGPRAVSCHRGPNKTSLQSSLLERNTIKLRGPSTYWRSMRMRWRQTGSTGSQTLRLATRPSTRLQHRDNLSSATRVEPTRHWSSERQPQREHCNGVEGASTQMRWSMARGNRRSMSMAPTRWKCASPSRWASSITTPAHQPQPRRSHSLTPTRPQPGGRASRSVSAMPTGLLRPTPPQHAAFRWVQKLLRLPQDRSAYSPFQGSRMVLAGKASPHLAVTSPSISPPQMLSSQVSTP